MISIQKELTSHKYQTEMILTVHDELLFNTPLEEEKVVQQMVKSLMEQAVVLEVPLVAEVGRGNHWLEAHGS